MLLNNIYMYIRTVAIHKYYVGYYCFKAKLYKQGILHDLSKFSYTELSELIRYANNKESPIKVCKRKNGYSKAWFHHRGVNPHHYEMWIDNFDDGGHPIQMPFKFVLELICDYLGAGRTYMKNNFSYSKEYQWWLRKISHGICMHYVTLNFIDKVLYNIAQNDSIDILSNREELFRLYKSIELRYYEMKYEEEGSAYELLDAHSSCNFS